MSQTGFETTLLFSERLTRAIDYARVLHLERRKGTSVPYLAHLIGVAALVMGEAGREPAVTEEMVMAAVLHDAAEDHAGCGSLFAPHVIANETRSQDR